MLGDAEKEELRCEYCGSEDNVSAHPPLGYICDEDWNNAKDVKRDFINAIKKNINK
jgi:hypothetical protein